MKKLDQYTFEISRESIQPNRTFSEEGMTIILKAIRNFIVRTALRHFPLTQMKIKIIISGERSGEKDDM